MDLKLEDIELSDNKIIQMRFLNNHDLLFIDIENSYLINEKKWLGRTQITISNWEDLTVENYISKEPGISGEIIKIDWRKEFYEFEMIQDKTIKNDSLSLSGFNKYGKGWLTYTFKKCKYSIVTEL